MAYIPGFLDEIETVKPILSLFSASMADLMPCLIRIGYTVSYSFGEDDMKTIISYVDSSRCRASLRSIGPLCEEHVALGFRFVA